MTRTDLLHATFAILLVVNAFAMPWTISVLTTNEDVLCGQMSEGMRNVFTLRGWRLCP